MPDLSITTGVVAALVASAVGGAIGGYLSGYRAKVTGSILIGTVGGTAFAVVLKAVNVNPVIGVEGYSLVFAFLIGGLTSWIVGRFS
jgi:hypothetical protein